MIQNAKKKSEATRLIESALSDRFTDVQVYQYNPGSIRIRVIDEVFEAMSRADREDRVWSFIDPLPDDVVTQITVLLLLAPGETDDSLMNVEFEDPRPSVL